MNKHIELSKQSKKLLFSGITAAALALVVAGPHAVKADSVSGSTLAAQSLNTKTAKTFPSKSLWPTLPASAKTADVKNKVTTKSNDTIDDWMPDKNLQQVVAYNLYGNPNSVDKITKDDLAKLTNLSVTSELAENDANYYAAAISIKSLTGLEYATNLESIDLAPNINYSIDHFGPAYALLHSTLSNINAIKGLKNLDYVNFQQCSISDISALANKPSLTRVSISYNGITDFSPLGSDTNLNLNLTQAYYQDVSSNGYYLSSSTPFYTFRYNNLIGIDGKPMKIRVADTDDVQHDHYVKYYLSNWKKNAGVVSDDGKSVTWDITGISPDPQATHYMTINYKGSHGEGGWFIIPFIVYD
ncbi:leucine-rich repeat domain-containing protein [Lactobacillus kullabergensis]|uniref:Leucine-rich repeat domain-containing protein n=1 Tax=Lactobacillus kullabergensis TaxID=1218493 RepID=A0ABM6W2D6_9LACO|nr:leucine-rich repeat domain-containing protein [Lactobacillus kullabergensis]AWM76044.1 hypothetical protein DKL58_08660 [Lactobacillus kullabergensis]